MNGQAMNSLTSNLVQSRSGAFYTDIKERDQNASNLRTYVNNLQNKIDYAKWKQNLVLKFNYMPMKRITEKVQNQRVNYVRKIAEEQLACAKMLSGKEITVQLDRFREFSKKLNQKMNEIQVKISEQGLKKEMMQQLVSQKRKRLKQLMKQNMQMVKANLQRSGVNTKEDIITLVRSKSTKERFNPTSITIDSQKQNEKERYSSNRKIKSQSSKRQVLKIKLYQQCLDLLINSIQSMKSSEDIQSGIYLDIMEKSQKKKQFSIEGRYSVRSKISDTLHSKFGSNQQLRMRNQKNKANFEMDWQTFKQLNWKQIMGIILVKDKNCVKTRKLLLYK